MQFARFAVLLPLLGALATAHGQSLLFNDNDANDVGRVEILVDGRPADIGATDFTLEFWMRSAAGNNAGAVVCNTSGYSWINGNIVFDRDRLDGGGRDFGLAIAGGRIAFGVESGSGNYTICSDSDVLDGEWHHIAVQRASSGALSLYVDGIREQQDTGPGGDVSYPDGQDPQSRQPLLVIGREKYDLRGTLGYNGWIDEVRLSSTLRYAGSSFTVPTQPFDPDANTAALYHLDEGAGDAIRDENSNASPGVRRFAAAAGPQWSAESAFAPSAGRVQFSPLNPVNEGTTSPLTVAVTRSGGTLGDATVDVAVTGGTATSGADYQFAPATLTWPNGQNGPRTATITLINDQLVEGNETINLALTNATGASLGSPNTAVVTITDNDSGAPSAGVLQFSAAAYAVTEATATLAIVVTRTNGSSGAASVNVAASGGTATLNSDYQISSTPLMWADGNAANKTFNITIVNDTIGEEAETISLELANPTGATVGAVSTATATINDDDQSSPPPPPPPAPPPTPAPTPTPAPPPTAARSGGGGALDVLLLLLGIGATTLRRLRRT